MISLEQIYSYFPDMEKTGPLKKQMLREYLQFMILDFLSTRPFINRIILVGGPALRFKYGLDRFTRDLFFNYIDCSEDDFIKMTDSVISFLEKAGVKVESKYKENSNHVLLKRYLYFPKFLFNIKFSVFDEKRFFSSIGVIQSKLMQGSTIKTKIEEKGFKYKQDLGYDSGFETINGCGFSFLFPMPSISTLFSMKLAALILRQNGRDFYDGLFLKKFAKPDYVFLKHRVGVSNKAELHAKITEALKYTDLESKTKDVEHLVFDKKNLERVKNFWKLIL
ncbi:MAG: nucleotidyl transferase AbiEii/AbiGii toxin family protein [Fibromonadaceae bacterium]|jgi:predicted nucleotidyltransferase component of viral defense system|nr:nucleotidyl transferase AbiEii/AbiGii toxin family protein [Fibromonadaceae bacterium]